MAELLNTSLYSDGNLKAYYRMESGALTTDSKGSYTLTNNGSVAETTGKFGGGATTGTNNSSKSFSIGNDLGITGNDITMVAWVKANQAVTGDSWYICSQTDSGTHVNHEVYYQDNSGVFNVWALRVKLGVGNVYTYTNANTDLTDDWHHVAYTYGADDKVRLYIDGELIGTSDADSANGGASGESDQFTIGKRSSGGAFYGDFSFDDVAVFNRELTGEEVTTLFTDGPSGGRTDVTSRTNAGSRENSGNRTSVSSRTSV